MREAARHAENASVEVLIGYDWFPGVVRRVDYWSDRSGNSYPVYTVTFADGKGGEIRCGHNSIRGRAS